LYQTDPAAADSDGDGFTDGIEIAKGFDPLNTVAEVPISYESPKETIGVTIKDKLVVESVRPDVLLATASTAEQVQTVVSGVALPHSFVTLYVFSTPTIVTVRTDETGAFEYTFTRELEDGEHQVFAALTDNTGEIVAQSEAFTFIKEARAFTLVEAEQPDAPSAITTYGQPAAADNSYQIVIGMAILAFGILLLLLGIGLRSNKPETVVVSEE